MTLDGTVYKTAFLLAVLVAAAAAVWEPFVASFRHDSGYQWILVAAVAGLAVAIVTIWKKTWSPLTAPIYAAIEGVVVAGSTAVAELIAPGVALQAVMLTGGTLLGLLLAYRSGLIKATENFKLGVTAATAGIALVYLVSIVLGFFGISLPFIHDNGWIGIGVSLFIVVIAALNLVLDFDFIEQGVKAGAPKYMEWFAAFGLMVTLIWLYLEILRLLLKRK
jgi:uncharacterized YccA/Bax inhibitor family protein